MKRYANEIIMETLAERTRKMEVKAERWMVRVAPGCVALANRKIDIKISGRQRLTGTVRECVPEIKWNDDHSNFRSAFRVTMECGLKYSLKSIPNYTV